MALASYFFPNSHMLFEDEDGSRSKCDQSNRIHIHGVLDFDFRFTTASSSVVNSEGSLAFLDIQEKLSDQH